MPRAKTHVLLPGSERKAVAGTKRGRLVDPNQRIEVTVRVGPRKPLARSVEALMKVGTQPPSKRKYLSREDFARSHGADPDDVAKIDSFAHEHGLTVVRTSPAQRTVKLAGTVAAFTAAFGVKLQMFTSRGLSYRGRTGGIYIPKELKGVIT